MTKIGTFTFIKAILDQQQEAIRLIDTCTVLGAESEGETIECQTVILCVLAKRQVEIEYKETLDMLEFQLENLENWARGGWCKDEMAGRAKAWKEAIKTLKNLKGGEENDTSN
ncbi:hypothetical protein [Loigolactobacillus bifermentans]|uniref:Uncharacterized protein n=1 Tax=Loigolactobacillus bifermentans DSM 20003 TaxID=1423726 RepID=A0A0R1H039_9LACO|nr:hypothetical protein [Loigolactobacillus bifermentans]KRK39980.1 hypothetical protein FC07_GL001777 [Loigolactobacillus bifermentans DSM 20003]QGG59676.1 hypothetical protein LB003_03805 [Loigolactobacillus bifermentans]